MKISKIEDGQLVFDNNRTISFDYDYSIHYKIYADFSQLDDAALDYDFSTSDLAFEYVENEGFKFGDFIQSFFVPCYCVQCHHTFVADSNRIDIYYGEDLVLSGSCKIISNPNLV